MSSKPPLSLHGRLLRAALEDALDEHESEGELTGYFLVTFQNGKTAVSARYEADDEVAAAVIETIQSSLTADADDAPDLIGRCLGTA